MRDVVSLQTLLYLVKLALLLSAVAVSRNSRIILNIDDLQPADGHLCPHATDSHGDSLSVDLFHDALRPQAFQPNGVADDDVTVYRSLALQSSLAKGIGSLSLIVFLILLPLTLALLPGFYLLHLLLEVFV